VAEISDQHDLEWAESDREKFADLEKEASALGVERAPLIT
jgi:hypothetical protein